MARIYKLSDRIPVKIGNITITISPLTVDQKVEIETHMLAHRRGDNKAGSQGIVAAVKYAVKSISGVEDGDGNPYTLQFDSSGQLTDECVSDLFNLGMDKQLSLVCTALTRGVPDQFTDESGRPIEGVELIKQSKQEPLAKNA